MSAGLIFLIVIAVCAVLLIMWLVTQQDITGKNIDPTLEYVSELNPQERSFWLRFSKFYYLAMVAIGIACIIMMIVTGEA